MYVTPIKEGWVSLKYGLQKDGYWHAGVDIACPMMTAVFAVADGIVIGREFGAYGKYIDLYFDEDWHMPDSQRYMARYAHLEMIFVGTKQKVKAGQLIGYTGSSGKSSGPHLHFELHIPGKGLQPGMEGYKTNRHGCVDPLLYIEFELDGKIINPLDIEEDWRVSGGKNAVDYLCEQKILSNPEFWKKDILEPKPSYAILMLLERIVRGIKEPP